MPKQPSIKIWRERKDEGKRMVGQVEVARRDGENVLDLLLNA